MATLPSRLSRRRPRDGTDQRKSGAVIYVRVSTKDQLDNFSIETQLAACRACCERSGLTILKEFEEAASAKSTERPHFQDMLSFCKLRHRQIGAVVVYALSRFSRNAHDFHQTWRSLTDLGIRLISATEPFDGTSYGRMQAGIYVTFAQF